MDSDSEEGKQKEQNALQSNAFQLIEIFIQVPWKFWHRVPMI